MTDVEKPLKEGYLWLPPKSTFLLVSKPWQKKFCRLFCSSKQGRERLEISDTEDDAKNSGNFLTLENCIKICEDSQKNQSHVFAVITKTSTHHFSANSHDDMLKWISAFQTVAFRDNASRQTIEEDNDLYCSAGDSGIFSVKLVGTDASERCGLEPGPYTLVVTSSALQLHCQDDIKMLVTWPYRFIRRYGYSNSSGKVFTFEAGRKCSTGEGFFKFEHSHQQDIFHCISSKMKHMKKLLSGAASGDAPLFCGESPQLHAALNMGARSRSPLPPSPTNSTSGILESEFSSLAGNRSDFSLKLINNNNSGINNNIMHTSNTLNSAGMISRDNSSSSFKSVVSCDSSPTGDRVFPGAAPNSHISLLDKHNNGIISTLSRRGASHERTLSRERSRSTDRSLSLERPRTLSLLPSPPPLSLFPSPPPLSLLPSPPPPTERPPPPPPKPKLPCKPEKPPRKSLPNIGAVTGGGGIQPVVGVASYDDVELRSDAWRTLGLANAPHSERPYIVPRPSELTPSSSGPDTQKIFVSTSSFHMNDYDTLQHLGTSSKTVSPGYRQVGPSLTLARSRSTEMLDDSLENKTDHKLICSAKV